MSFILGFITGGLFSMFVVIGISLYVDYMDKQKDRSLWWRIAPVINNLTSRR